MPDMTWECAEFFGSCAIGDWIYVFHKDGCERLNVVDPNKNRKREYAPNVQSGSVKA